MRYQISAHVKPIVIANSPSKCLIVLSLLGASLMCSCTKDQYIAKPINASQTSSKLVNKDIYSAEFNAFLIQQGYADSALPLKQWGLNELTLCALYHHSQLDVAKAQLALANASLETAGVKPTLNLTGSLAKSNQANQDIRPWAYGLNVEIPIETSNKRAIRIEEAQHLAEVARITIAETAWQLRSQITKDWLDYHDNLAQIQLLSQLLQTHDKRIQLLEKRVQVGTLSNTELLSAQLLQQEVRYKLNSEQAKTNEIIANLAADVGLTVEKFTQIPLLTLDVEATLAQQTKELNTITAKKLQENALLNRLDIRRSLEKYAAAEAKIKLEVAKQTPDISLSPGFAFEFGDSIWSLGFSTLLSLLNKNPTLINEATQLRAIEGAEFEALQARIIADVDQYLAGYQANLQNVQQAKLQLDAQFKHQQKIQGQFDAGLIDRLALTQHALNSALLKQQWVTAQFKLLHVVLKLEDTMQRPIDHNLTLQTSDAERKTSAMAGTSP